MDTKTGEFERLQQMYAELGHDHLMDLYDDRDELTQEARLALDQELLKRKLVPAPHTDEPAPVGEMHERSDGFGVGVPGVFPGAAAAVEEALEPNGQVRAGMVRLVSFYDGMQLSQACTALEDADVEPAIEESAGDATIGTPTSFQIWVDAGDVEAGQAALRQKLGLFPLAEASEVDDHEAAGEASDGVVGSFELETEAEAVKALLIEAGFAATTLPSPDADEDGVRWINVQVPPSESVKAIEFLEQRMGLED
jgi:hypothetical protein